MATVTPDKKIALVLYSPDPKLARLLTSVLVPEFDVRVETDRDQVVEIARNAEADLVLADLDSNYSTPEEQHSLCGELGETPLPVVVMSDEPRRTTEFLQRGVFDCIRKPPSLIELRLVVRRACEHQQMKTELRRMREVAQSGHRCDQLVGGGGRSLVLFDLIRRVTNLNAYVLVTGESGTGKELVARAIHNLGNRADHPFVAVSCGAIPETLIESELFGHEKGAFTGSVGARAGYLEQAGQGTIFLDEIGELSLSTQVKLLRVLQEREFSRLGSSRLIPLRARVIFATHRNLDEMVEEGTFRRDLYFRVNVLRIQVPSLRERTEDIPLLARHILEKYSAEYGKQVEDIRPAAMQALVDYDWPGNIRELENVIQGAVIMTDEDSIGPGDLPAHVRQEGAPVHEETAEGGTFDEMLRQFKVELAVKAVQECQGNKTLAARKLKVSRAYLHRLLRAEPQSVTSIRVVGAA
jgi:DNA-binding NtrC family response regulator